MVAEALARSVAQHAIVAGAVVRARAAYTTGAGLPALRAKEIRDALKAAGSLDNPTRPETEAIAEVTLTDKRGIR